MGDDRRQKLIDLEAECLADALLELAVQSVTADDREKGPDTVI